MHQIVAPNSVITILREHRTEEEGHPPCSNSAKKLSVHGVVDFFNYLVLLRKKTKGKTKSFVKSLANLFIQSGNPDPPDMFLSFLSHCLHIQHGGGGG